jgi:hypothetical protein
MKTTTIREFDSEGRLVRETVVADDAAQPVRTRWGGGQLYPSLGCTCGPWHSIMPPPPCPVHGQAIPATITC